MKINIHQAFAEMSREKNPYYRQYTHDVPMILSHETYARTQQLGKILYKAIRYLLTHYADFLYRMPMDGRVLEILERCAPYPLRIHSYRADFVINDRREIQITELNARFALNGYICAGFLRNIGLEMAHALGLHDIRDEYPRFLDFLQDHFAPAGKIIALKGNEPMNDFKLYSELFPAAHIDFRVIDPKNLNKQIRETDGAAIISELSQEEIKSLDNSAIEALTAAGIYNDFRHIFLAHDKRFLQLLTDPVFLNAALSPEEQQVLARFTIPTYTLPHDRAAFDRAYADKNQWILKPHLLGKGKGIVAGPTVTEEEWQRLFDTGQIHDKILQPMIAQPRFATTIGNEVRNDYIVGTLLYFGDAYYGPGEFRASSFCVTNQGDHRKRAQVVAARDGRWSDITL
jgi:hypothetical protein